MSGKKWRFSRGIGRRGTGASELRTEQPSASLLSLDPHRAIG